MSFNPFARVASTFGGLATALARGGRQLVVDDQSAFSGGLNTATDPLHISPTEVVRAENGLLTEFGAMVKRRGTQRTHFAAFGADIQNGTSWTPLTATTEYVVAGGTLWRGVYNIPMVFAQTGSTGALEATGVPGFAAYTDGSDPALHIADGGALNKLVGTTLTTNIASTPNVTRVCAYNDRLWGITGVDNILYGSSLGDGDTLGISGSGGGAFAISTYGEQQIVEILPLGNSLILIQRHGVSRFSGWTADDFQVLNGTRGLSSDVGTVCATSVCTHENEGFFLSDRGFYSVTEGGVRPESPQIRNMLASLSQADWANVRCANFKALYELRWFIPGLGVMVFNYRPNVRKWSGPLTGTYLNTPVVAMWSTVDQSDRPIVLTGHNDRYVRRTERPSAICKDDVLADGTGGLRYNLVIKPHRLFCRDAVSEKAFRFAWVTCNLRTSNRASLLCETDSDSAVVPFPFEPRAGEWDQEGATWDAMALGQPEPWYWGAVAYDRKRLQLAGHGEWIDLTIQDDGYAESLFARIDLRAYSLGER